MGSGFGRLRLDLTLYILGLIGSDRSLFFASKAAFSIQRSTRPMIRRNFSEIDANAVDRRAVCAVSQFFTGRTRSRNSKWLSEDVSRPRQRRRQLVDREHLPEFFTQSQ